MYDALYGRQSIEKKDSISIESQLEFCKYETHGNPYKIYADSGFSGKDTHRPDFEKMMNDIMAGKIKRVIVYKLDRISRSILDFSNMMDFFQRYNVEFVSSTEKFDTGSPIGRAMLNICIVFAQLERETIQKRVTDAYYSRSKRGFYMGGRVPYGFNVKRTVIDGIKTSMYEPVPEESEQIRLMYSLYADPSNSLGDIVNYLNKNGIEQLRGGMWSTARISDMLRNPVYVKADAGVYEFFAKNGANIINPVSDFTGYNACYLYRGTTSNTRKQCDLSGKEIVLAPHEGIIPSSIWVKCRMRCFNNRQSTKACKAKNSWLTGKIKCKSCGYSLTIAKANTSWSRYFICGTKLRTKGGKCHGTGGTVYADVLEKYIHGAIKEKLAQFKILSCLDEVRTNPRHNEIKIRIAQIDREISDLLSKIAGASGILMAYINSRAEELDGERKKLREELASLEFEIKNPCYISNHLRAWNEASFEDKQLVTDILIKVIHIGNGVIEITWNI